MKSSMAEKEIRNFIKCSICGKYIAYKELDRGTVKSTYIPDGLFSIERIEYAHQTCLDNEQLR